VSLGVSVCICEYSSILSTIHTCVCVCEYSSVLACHIHTVDHTVDEPSSWTAIFVRLSIIALLHLKSGQVYAYVCVCACVCVCVREREGVL